MESQGFEPRSWDFSYLSTPIDHHTVSYAFFSSKTTEVPKIFFYFLQFLELKKIHKYIKIINNIKLFNKPILYIYYIKTSYSLKYENKLK